MRVFVSYSSKSKDLVTTLAQDIENAGYQIWFDHKLTGGQAWWDQILENIRQCDLFVFALTIEALDSYPCQLEYGYAHSLGKNILPILLTDGVSINLLPSELTTIQFVDYRSQDRQAAFRLMNSLNKLPPPQPLPNPLPVSPEVPISYIGNLKDQIDLPRALTFDEQASLVFKLKEYLREAENRDDALNLLRRMKKREDLFAKIDKEIDGLLIDATSAATPLKNTPVSTTTSPKPAYAAAAPHLGTAGQSANRMSQPFDWAPALVTAAVGWGISGVIYKLPLIVLILIPTLATMPSIILTLVDGFFNFCGGFTQAYVNSRVLRRTFPPSATYNNTQLMVSYGFISVLSFIVVTILASADPNLVSFINSIISWLLESYVLLQFLRKVFPHINSSGVYIPWLAAYAALFLMNIFFEPTYAGILNDTTLDQFSMWTNLVMTDVIVSVVSLAVGGTIGCGLILRTLQKT